MEILRIVASSAVLAGLLVAGGVLKYRLLEAAEERRRRKLSR